jgi:flagellin
LTKAGTFTAQSATTPATLGTDKFNVQVYTPDKTSGIALVAKTAGVTGQISGFTISITDSNGNVKKAANAALDQFKQYQRAENQTGDKALTFHIGSEANVAIKVGIGDMRAEALGLKGSSGERVSVTTKENANAAINTIENALAKALDQQTTIGAIEARLEYTSANLTTSSENVQASESTIRDADMAKEMTNYTKNNVLLQSAQAMLAQANQSSSAVLSLLQ